jgi:hypothetical protein
LVSLPGEVYRPAAQTHFRKKAQMSKNGTTYRRTDEAGDTGALVSQLADKLRANIKDYDPKVSFMALVNALARDILSCTPTEKDAMAAAADMGEKMLDLVKLNGAKFGFGPDKTSVKVYARTVSQEKFDEHWNAKGDVEIEIPGSLPGDVEFEIPADSAARVFGTD